ncbi:MAG TPA: DUF3102 domain-containing protein [Stenomitos sp.]
MSETLPLFDYSALDRDTSAFLIEKTAEVKALMRQTVENVVKTGLILQEVKDLLPYGQWALWCESEFGWHYRTAQRMIRAAETFTLDTVSDLNIGASALYILSAPTTPEEAREEALHLAKQGQSITKVVAEDLRRRHLGHDPKTLHRSPSVKETPPQQEIDWEPQVEVPQTIPVSVTTPEAKKPLKSGQRERLKKSPDQTPAFKINRDLITSKAKSVEAGQTWRLGGLHILYCGQPTDPKFLKRLPQKTALLLEFPPSRTQLLPDSFATPFQSCFTFTTHLHVDFDLNVLREAIESIIEGSTDGGDAVVLYCLPDPAIFLLLDQLQCIAYCAEPDPNKCNMAIAAWTTVTKRSASRT